MTRSKSQNRQIHGLLSRLGLKDNKEVLALDFSNGRTDKTSELTYQEAERLILSLQTAARTGKTVTHEIPTSFSPGNNMRRKIFWHFRKCGFVNESGNVDVKAVNDWVERYGYLNKPLMNYTAQELPRLVSQSEAVYESFKKSIN